MITLKGKLVYLRALEPEDLEFVNKIENDERIWELSNTQTPFSKYVIKQYIEHSHLDIYEVKQLRLMISNYEDEAIGLVDLFDFDFKNKRAGVGIIMDELYRSKGLANEAIKLLIAYSFTHLNLHQLYCNISEDNKKSIRLFENNGFKVVGLKKDWNRVNKRFKNEYLYQLISE